MNRPAFVWQPCERTSAYIRSDHKLFKGSCQILITYETRTGRRYVKAVRCNNGRVNKTINGQIIAWAYMPDPYEGNPETVR